jgi:hypothetical protein
LNRHEPHVGPRHRFADRLGISRVVLVGLHIWLDELRRNQAHVVSKALQLARPMMRAAAGFHADQAPWQIREELGYLGALELLLQYCLTVLINAVDLEDIWLFLKPSG